MSTDPIYVDRSRRIIEGEEAARLIAERNQEFSVEEGRGVAAVGAERWKEAQEYERRTWLESSKHAIDDHNWEHVEHFDGYRELAGRPYRRAIELGCGPFTNMRFILGAVDVDEVTLLDPLASDYLTHPNCRYRGGRLGGIARQQTVQAFSTQKNPWRAVRELAVSRGAGGLRGKPVEVVTSGIEDYEPDGTFDLVVMINVIEHCRSADEVFSRILQMTEPGSVFVFHDRLYDAAEIERRRQVIFDAGHPLNVERRMIEGFLKENFDRQVTKTFERRKSFRGMETTTDHLYYIGRRKG